MARHIRLRPSNEHPATAGRFAVLQSVSPVHLAAILAVMAAGFLAVWQLAGLGAPRPAAPQRGALGEPQSRAPLAVDRGNRKRTLHTPTLESRSNVFAAQRHQTSDFRLLPVALLTLAGVNIKKRPGGSKVGAGSPKIAVANFLPAFGASVPAATDAAEVKKVLDLSRPTRAGPLRGQAIDLRASASLSFDPPSRRDLGGE